MQKLTTSLIEAIENKYKIFQLTASKKENNLKVADKQIAQVI